MSNKTEKRDMDAIRAAHKSRMNALKQANQIERELEAKRKLALRQKIEEKEAAERKVRAEHEFAEKSRLSQCLMIAKDLVKQHIDTLVVKYSQLVQPDDYGHINYSKWESQRAYFLSRIVYPRIGGKECGIEPAVLENIVDGAVKKSFSKRSETLTSAKNLSPIEYEMYCAAQLNRIGWKTVLTKTSGDQGVDVIADKEKIRLAIQCKRYSSPVGNAAVQEICAGMKFVKAQFGAVVSNAPFTPQARQLAISTNVLLLHHSDLERIDSLLKKQAEMNSRNA